MAKNYPWVRYTIVAVYLALIVGVVLAWRQPELRRHLEPAGLASLGRAMLAMPLGPVLVLLGYVVAVQMGLPIAVLVSVGALIFGPWPGMAYALFGMLLGATVTYGIGRWAGARLVDRWTTDGRLYAMAQAIKRRGLWAVILVRVLPVAPFIVINLAAGAFRVRLRDFVVGSFIGLIPGTILISLFTDRLAAAWRNPDAETYTALAAVVIVALLCLAALPLIRRWWLLRR